MNSSTRGRPSVRHLLCLMLVFVVLAQEPSNQELGRARQRLQELQLQKDQVENQLNQLHKRRSGVLVELQGIRLRASKARIQAEVAQLKRDEIRRELAKLAERKREISRELSKLKESLRRQIKWLQALGPLGTLSFFPSHADIENYLVRSRYLDWWRNNENQKLKKALALHAEMIEREKEITEAEIRFSKVRDEMAALQEELRANEKQLQENLNWIQQDEEQKQRLQAELREESILLERMLSSILSKAVSDAPVHVITPFSSLLGKLRSPVEGTLAGGYGVQTHPRFGTKTMNQGLQIAAKSGAPVHAVADGQVVMAGAFQSYGLIVIIDHGNAYHSLYKHMQAISVSGGQAVKSGETVGYVGDTHDGPRLGFEIRHKKNAEDPQRWLASKYVTDGK